MRLAIVGSGYVGLVAAACFAELGHEVVSVDNDQAKIAALQRGEIPIHEEFLPALLEKHRGRRLRFSSSLHEGMCGAAIFIAVGTPPTGDGEADLSFVEAVSREVAGNVEDYKVVVEKSTIPCLDT